MNNTIDKKYLELVGAGGGSRPRSPREAPNSLQAKQTFEVVEVVSEGEIQGFVGGLKGVYFDNVPVEDQDGNFNFAGVRYESRNGTQNQAVLPGFIGTRTTLFTPNTELNRNGTTFSGPYTIDSQYEGIIVSVNLPAGLSNTNTSNGDINGHNVTFIVEARPGLSGSFTQIFAKTISGKTMRPYSASYRIEKPNGYTGQWQIRVRRNPSALVSNIQDQINLSVITGVNDEPITYPNAAVVGIKADAEATGGQIPVRSYLIDGIICKVPVNYTPTSYNPDGTVASYASYSGNWNGTFKDSWTDDPAWIIYDLLTNARYGLGLDPTNIDPYSFYDCSVYNCELIDNGQSGTAPRFTCNTVIQTREDAYKTIQAIAAVCRATVFSGPGLIKIIQDRPTPVSRIITNSNVIDGAFTYTGTELSQRYTSCDVTFNDRTDRYLPKTVNETAANDEIERYGFNKLELSLLGCVDEAQARRMAKWAIDTSLNQTETVSFQVGFNNLFVEIGDVISVADEFYSGVTFAGLIKGGTTSTIILDRPVTITSGQTIRYTTFAGVEVTRTISNGPGTYTTLNINSGEDVSAYVGAPWALFGEIVPRQFKVTSISESSPGILSVNAIFYDPNKYARVEQGLIISNPIYSDLGGFTIGRPSVPDINIETYISPIDSSVTYGIRLNWDDLPNARKYRVKYRRDANQYVFSDFITQSEFIIPDAVIDSRYEYFIYGYTSRDVQGPARSGTYLFEQPVSASPLAAPTNLFVTGTNTTIFDTPDLNISWVAPPQIPNAVMKDYEIRFYESDNTTLRRTIFQESNTIQLTNLNIREIYNNSLPRSFFVRVRGRDTLNRVTNFVVSNFTNPAPSALTGITITPKLGYYEVNHNPLPSGAQGVRIYHSTTAGFTANDSTLVKEDVGTKHIVEAENNQSYFVRIGAYDSYSKDNLNLSNEISVTAGGGLGFNTPSVPTGLTVNSSTSNDNEGRPVTTILVQWNRSSPVAATQYDLEIIEGSNPSYTIVVADPNGGSTATYNFIGQRGVLYRCRVRGRNGDVVSSYSSQVSHTPAGLAAPAAPTALGLLPSYTAIRLVWTNPNNVPLSRIDVYRKVGINGTYSFLASVTSFQVGTNNQLSATYLDSGLDRNITYYYKVKAVNLEGTESGFSNEVSGAPLLAPENSIPASAFLGTIQSDNYNGTNGWQINRDNGDAYFGQLFARGKIVTGTSPGFRVEVDATDSVYALWAGNGVKNDDNAIFYIKNNGSAYFGGSLRIGSVNSSAENNQPQTGSSQVLVLGPFTSTAGKDTIVNANLDYFAISTAAGNCTSYSNNTFVVKIDRSTDGSNWTEVNSRTITFSTTGSYDLETNTCTITAENNESWNFTDTTSIQGNRYYRMRFQSYSTYHSSNFVTNKRMFLQAIQE
jgi:predicted phage tail protein